MFRFASVSWFLTASFFFGLCLHFLLVVGTSVLSRFGCHSFRVSGPTISNDLPVDFRSTDITREQFKRSLKSWLFECAYGRRRVWETVQSEGAPKKWTYLLTYNSTFVASIWSSADVFIDVVSYVVVLISCFLRWAFVTFVTLKTLHRGQAYFSGRSVSLFDRVNLFMESCVFWWQPPWYTALSIRAYILLS